jgi:hypothetical protein
VNTRFEWMRDVPISMPSAFSVSPPAPVMPPRQPPSLRPAIFTDICTRIASEFMVRHPTPLLSSISARTVLALYDTSAESLPPFPVASHPSFLTIGLPRLAVAWSTFYLSACHSPVHLFFPGGSTPVPVLKQPGNAKPYSLPSAQPVLLASCITHQASSRATNSARERISISVPKINSENTSNLRKCFKIHNNSRTGWKIMK